MSTGTRVARAASTRQAKQELIRLLYGNQTFQPSFSKGQKHMDASHYSYRELKTAYLGRLQEIHPDKQMARQSNAEMKELERQFRELRDAWTKYEEHARTAGIENSTEDLPNFTMFGVGCSFSDSEEERALRAEITDQACRGWFSSGLLSESTATTRNESVTSKKVKPMSLVDDNLFVESTEAPVDNSGKDTTTKPKRKHLVPGLR